MMLKVRVELELSDGEKEALVRFAVMNNFLRANPRKAWKKHETAEAVRFAVKKLTARECHGI